MTWGARVRLAGGHLAHRAGSDQEAPGGSLTASSPGATGFSPLTIPRPTAADA